VRQYRTVFDLAKSFKLDPTVYPNVYGHFPRPDLSEVVKLGRDTIATLKSLDGHSLHARYAFWICNPHLLV
jgi:hypothetical protein